jgi:glycosyltransferase involved in cell wall biosynthesis
MNKNLNVVHIVANVSKINFGVWNAALFGSDYLHSKYGIISSLWVCASHRTELISSVKHPVNFLGDKSINDKNLLDLVQEHSLLPEFTIFVSHGCWLRPTQLGSRLVKIGFRWLYVPHGMLEPWSLKQGGFKKQIYYYFFERRYNKNASAIRAVSQAERSNLEKTLQRKIDLIENGIHIPEIQTKVLGQRVFLFMARLHFKKGVFPLVKAWHLLKSEVIRFNCKLVIAGPDEGELDKIKPYMDDTIEYVGSVYGDQKYTLLNRSHYYLLPSYSEGFPTSVLEAMSYGLIPLISNGCNFDEVFKHGLGFRIEPTINSVENSLKTLLPQPFDKELSEANRDYAISHFGETVIGENLHQLYIDILRRDTKLI